MIIAETGACFSGKTTFAESLKKLYPNVIRQNDIKIDNQYEDDNLRELNGLSIDQIRAHPYLYFRWEKAIISKKIEQERTALKCSDDSIVIFERSLADSIYYLTRFVDISSFNDVEINEYNSFLQNVVDAARYHYKYIYNHILIFKPVLFDQLNCERRPASLKKDHIREYHVIRLLNNGLLDPEHHFKISDVEMSSVSLDQIDSYVNFIFSNLR